MNVVGRASGMNGGVVMASTPHVIGWIEPHLIVSHGDFLPSTLGIQIVVELLLLS